MAAETIARALASIAAWNNTGPEFNMRVQAVTFDVGGTLMEPWPSVGHVYAEVAARHGVGNISPDFLQTRFREAWRARRHFNHARAGWEELVDEVFQGLAAPPPSATFFPKLYERFARPETWHVFDDVWPTLNALATRGLRLGIISNWDERLRPLLRRLRLSGFFETIVISCEAGSVKPARILFDQAASGFRLPPGSILHVGDSLENDVRGAEAAGFQALQIHRGAGKAGKGALTDLSGLLTRIVAPTAKTDKSV